MIIEDIPFYQGSLRLEGTLFRPENTEPCPVMVVLHAASGGERSHPFYEHLRTVLPAYGIGVYLYDRRGSGQSAGDFSTAGFTDLAEDAIAAVRYLRQRGDIDNQRIGLYGISQGGWIVPIVAAREPGIAFLVIVSGCGLSPAEQMDYAATYNLREAGWSEAIVSRAMALRQRVNEYYRGRLPAKIVRTEIEQVEGEPWFEYAYLDKSQALPEDILEDKWYYEMDYEPLPVWRDVEQPALFVFAEWDRWVPVGQSMTNFRQATAHLSDVTFTHVPGTDHLMAEMSLPEESRISERYVETLVRWLIDRL